MLAFKTSIDIAHDPMTLCILIFYYAHIIKCDLVSDRVEIVEKSRKFDVLTLLTK